MSCWKNKNCWIRTERKAGVFERLEEKAIVYEVDLIVNTNCLTHPVRSNSINPLVFEEILKVTTEFAYYEGNELFNPSKQDNLKRLQDPTSHFQRIDYI